MDLYYYSIEETKELILDDKKANVNGRRDFCVFVRDKEGRFVFSGEKARELFGIVESKVKQTVVQGFVACAPVDEIKGKVHIVKDAHDTTFRDGEILVTSMTRPEFYPLMKKAKAVITNEGGITSHAAIVSRELNLPCVIGTRNATKLLKTGNIVKINLITGEIK